MLLAFLQRGQRTQPPREAHGGGLRSPSSAAGESPRPRSGWSGTLRYAINRISATPSAPRQTLKGSAVVAIGADRREVGSDKSASPRSPRPVRRHEGEGGGYPTVGGGAT